MDIYQEIVSFLSVNDRLNLATVIASSGSTPVPAGAKMLIRGKNEAPIGSIGGGCLEAEILELSQELAPSPGTCVVRRFTLTEDDIESGMLCGGNMDVLIEPLVRDHARLYESLLARREEGRDTTVITAVDSGMRVLGKILYSPPQSPDELRTDEIPSFPLLGGEPAVSFLATVRDALARRSIVRVPLPGGELIIEPVVGIQDLFIFGAGHVSRFVSRSAAMAGFRVTVVDDRAAFANPERFPESHRTLAVGYDEAWDTLRVTPSASIVIVTRGHKFDERVLERAVRTPARYIGMIGSSKKVKATLTHLLERGIPRDRLRTVHAPIGLDIGAMTAEEIGISITAELIAVRRGVAVSPGAMSGRLGDFPGADAGSSKQP